MVEPKSRRKLAFCCTVFCPQRTVNTRRPGFYLLSIARLTLPRLDQEGPWVGELGLCFVFRPLRRVRSRVRQNIQINKTNHFNFVGLARIR